MDSEALVNDEHEYFEDVMDSIFRRAKEIMIRKRRMRGAKNISDQGMRGVITRLRDDKLTRVLEEAKREEIIDELMARGMPPETIQKYFPEPNAVETVEEDLLDSINYAFIALMLELGVWELPMRPKENDE